MAGDDDDDGKSVKTITDEDDPDWAKHPVRKFLYDELANNKIPINHKLMKPRDVWNKYCDMDIFEGLEYNRLFTSRLLSLRKIAGRNLSRAQADRETFANYRKRHQRPTHNCRGEPLWVDSEAKKLLEEDIDQGLHLIMLPSQLQNKRPEYQLFPPNVFDGHVRQALRTRKYHNYLEQEHGPRDENKL